MPEETVLAGTTPDTGTEATPIPEAVATDPALETKPDATGEPKTEEAKGEEPSKPDAKPEVPEVYDFKAPEGTTLDDGAIALVTPVLKELCVTQEGAQKLANTFAQIQAAQIVAQSEAWLTAAKADKEIGGKGFDANTKLAQTAFAKFATPELKSFLDSTGLGNHPELLRTFVKLGKAAQQDTHVTAGAGLKETDPARILFPSMNKK